LGNVDPGACMPVFRFGEFEADEEKFELRRGDSAVRVQRIVLETIFFLLRNAGRVVTKQELAQGPWKGLKVSDAAMSRAVMLARRAVADHSGAAIVTVHGRGYRFARDIEVAFAAPLHPMLDASKERAVSGRSVEHAGRYDDALGSSAFLASIPELALLRDEYERARAGQGRMVVVAGEAGTGNTALVERFAQQLEREGVLVAWGRCWKATCAPELWPWLEIVRHCLSLLDESDSEQIPPAVLSPIVALVSDLSCEEERSVERKHREKNGYLRVFDVVTRFLAELSRRRPLVALVEDVHDADEPSLLLLEFMRRRIRATSLLVVVTRGPLPLRHGGESPFDETGAHVRVLPVSGLSESSVGLLLEDLGRPGRDPRGRVHHIDES
jgi:DNA-binding winged helix-turn-helix (wHTH) protein